MVCYLIGRVACQRARNIPLTLNCMQSRLQVPPTIQYGYRQQRHLAGVPTVLLPPVVFGGLVIALWTWKCLMMVVFQNKIIYMPGLPPNARGEKIHEYKHQCGGIEWKEEKIRSTDGTAISLCLSSVDTAPEPVQTIYILYFQGQFISR